MARFLFHVVLCLILLFVLVVFVCIASTRLHYVMLGFDWRSFGLCLAGLLLMFHAVFSTLLFACWFWVSFCLPGVLFSSCCFAVDVGCEFSAFFLHR